MFTRDDIPKNGRIRGSITIVLRAVAKPSDERVDAELTVEDSTGDTLQMNIWSKHEIDIEWISGHKYELSGVRGKWWRKNGTKQHLLSSTRALSVFDCGSTETTTTKLLVIGDTHIGYRHRPQTDKPSWARHVDARNEYRRALELAQAHNVNAIVHAGDVFDHTATEADCQTVTTHLVEPLAADVPFYYIRGNHDPEHGIDGLKAFAEGAKMRLRLNKHPMSVVNSPVNLFGIDHTGEDLSNESLEPTGATFRERNVLVLHEKPYPVIDNEDELIYDTGANLSNLLNRVEVDIELIITGHMHVAKQGHVKGHDVPVLVTGPTVNISEYMKDNRPSAWLVTFSDNGPAIDRFKL